MGAATEFPEYVLKYANAILASAAVANFDAADGMLDAASTDLLNGGDSKGVGKLFVAVALKNLELPGRTGDVLSVSLIERLRSLADHANVEDRVKACKAIVDGLNGIVEKLPIESFAASSAKLMFLGAHCVLAVANGKTADAASMADFIDRNSNGQFRFRALVK